MTEVSADDFADVYGYLPSRRTGGLVFFSGVFGMNPDGSIPADPETQYELAFASLDEALRAEGLTKANLVDLLTFHTDYPSNMETFMRVKKEYLGGLKTCWTAIGAAALGEPATLVEMRAVAEAI